MATSTNEPLYFAGLGTSNDLGVNNGSKTTTNPAYNLRNNNSRNYNSRNRNKNINAIERTRKAVGNTKYQPTNNMNLIYGRFMAGFAGLMLAFIILNLVFIFSKDPIVEFNKIFGKKEKLTKSDTDYVLSIFSLIIGIIGVIGYIIFENYQNNLTNTYKIVFVSVISLIVLFQLIVVILSFIDRDSDFGRVLEAVQKKDK